MRAIRTTITIKGEEYEKHNGHYTPTTLAEENDQRADHQYEDRLDELRLKAQFMVSRMKLGGVEITQVGKNGFFYKKPGQVVPEFEPWNPVTQLENERIFNATA